MPPTDDRHGSGAPDPDGEVLVATSARAGFVARGALYALLGVLALRLAFGETGTEASQQGAMDVVASRPFGGALLSVLTGGLVAYAAFRIVEAVRGRGEAGVFERRVVPAVRGAVYAGLAALAAQEVAGAGDSPSESSVTATVLGWSGGRLLVGTLGLVIVGVGVRQLLHALRGDGHELVVLARLPPRRRRLADGMARAGFLGRTVTFGLAGGFLVRSAWRVDPDEGVGLDAALQELTLAPYGAGMLVLTAVGLLAFGAHCALEAWWANAAGPPPGGTIEPADQRGRA